MYRASDFVKPYYKTGEVARILGVGIRAVQGYDRRGLLRFDRTTTNRRMLSRERLLEYLDRNNMLSPDDGRRDVIYARVSSQDQKRNGDLDRQVLHIVETQSDRLVNPLILKECGSGLNDKRPKLQQLLDMVLEDKVRNVYVTYADRLTRFGYEYLRTVFTAHGTFIRVINKETTDRDAREELVEDMMSLITSFSGKLYGLRSHSNTHKEAQS